MSRTSPPQPKSFAQLIDEEDAQLQAGRATRTPAGDRFDRVIGQPGSAEEPWVSFTNRDRVGLAFSGGGIRSATFNLGLLQALRHKGLLDQIDYLGTVSGGGYVGGFWTAWRSRSMELDAPDGVPLLFPKQTQTNTADGLNNPDLPSPKEIRERPEIRHLREFSRFLMPRVGFMAPETWNGIVAILFGLVPSLLVTLAVIGLGLSAWLLLNAVWLNSNHWVSGGIMFAVSLIIHLGSEVQFRKRGAAESAEWNSASWWTVPLLLSGLSAAIMAAVRYWWDFVPGTPVDVPAGSEWRFDPGLINPAWGVFFPVMIWSLTALALVSARLLCRRQSEMNKPFGRYTALALDRGIARCLVPAVVWSTFGVLWLLAIWLLTRPAGTGWSFRINGGIAVALTGLFAWLRDWLAKPVQRTNAETLLSRLKPVLPQLLAYGAVAALFVLVSQGLLFFAFDAHHSDWPRLAIFGGACLAIILAALWLFDPMNVGLHEFYRSRITRCFLGAANPEALQKSAQQNRQTNERQHDDLCLGEISSVWIDDPVPRWDRFRSLRLRPIHLICCAANHLSGDPLGSLYRGARSAVLSQRGITLGNETASLPDLRLSSALTASAAAFNSNMGALSMHLGAPVAFLMTALNLRLGLWVPHPRNPNRQRSAWPGVFFFREMFGQTTAGSPPARVVETDPRDRFQPAAFEPADGRRHLHLSDGAHFENLSLYELVRRHCRYLIVSDCGADPEYSFDDFANTIRRVREDFGVEIEMDFTPLQPGTDGFARQHAVAGTIHYDGVTGCDKGTLLYFKPVLTGNEPGDVLQYKISNPIFPQEGTADQFYDEAQWESYHRLGEHSGHECFRFLENVSGEKRRSAESVFHFARAQWQPGWQEQDEQYLALTARCALLEADIRDHAPAHLRAEFFPEVAAHHPALAAPTADEEIRAVYFLMLITQVMEDAWLACRLETHGAHPLNQGWMSYLQRWAATPSFRRWWPVLKPIYSPGFRHFAKRQFGLEFKDVTSQGTAAPARSLDTQLRLQLVSLATARHGFAWQQWERRQVPPVPSPPFPPGQRLCAITYDLSVPSPAGLPPLPPLQVGVVLATVDAAARQACWTTNQFFMPPALNGAGFIGRFLDALITHFKSDPGIDVLRVTILDAGAKDSDQRPHPDPVSRARRVELVDFYKSRGFAYDRPAAGQLHEFNQLVCRVN